MHVQLCELAVCKTTIAQDQRLRTAAAGSSWGALRAPTPLFRQLCVPCRARLVALKMVCGVVRTWLQALTDSKMASSSSFLVSVRPCFCSMSYSHRQL